MDHAVSYRREIVKQANRDAVQCARQRSSWRVATVYWWRAHAPSIIGPGTPRHAAFTAGVYAKKIRADGLETVEINGRVAMLAHEFESFPAECLKSPS